jgi:cell division initiation protein
MSLTSEALRKAEFREGWRGYNQVDVDVFLEEVAAGVDALNAEITELKTRTDRAEARVPAAGTAPETDETVRRTLTLAQRAADLVVSEAKAVAERIVADSHAQAARITANADLQAAAIKTAAETQARESAQAEHQLAAEQHQRALAAIVAQHETVGTELDQRRHELDDVRQLTVSARDRLRAALTDHMARLDRLEASGTPLASVHPASGPDPVVDTPSM